MLSQHANVVILQHILFVFNADDVLAVNRTAAILLLAGNDSVISSKVLGFSVADGGKLHVLLHSSRATAVATALTSGMLFSVSELLILLDCIN